MGKKGGRDRESGGSISPGAVLSAPGVLCVC